MNNPGGDLNRVWATPFYRSRTESERAHRLRDYILANEGESRRKLNSPQRAHPGVFESEFNFLDWPSPVTGELKQFLLGHLAGVVRNAAGLDEAATARLRIQNHCWFHITRNGGYFQHHNHPMASWSLVYCVDPGDPEPPNEFEAGHLVFHDPRATASMYLDPANRRWARDFSFDAVRMRPEAGEVLIFPSYVHHTVEPYRGDRPRISVAANFWFGVAA